MHRKRLPLWIAVAAVVAALSALTLGALPAGGDDGPPTCYSYAGTTTCQAAAAVAQHGIFIAIVSCDPDTAEIHGVLPGDATRITTVGATGTSTATAGPGGAVALTVPGGDLTGLALDNGHTAPLALEADCSMPTAP